MSLLLILLAVLLAGALIWLQHERRQRASLAKALAELRTTHEEFCERYRSIIDVDAEANRIRASLAALAQERERVSEENRNRQVDLNRQYEAAKSVYERLKAEVSTVEENLEDISFGIYKPHYDFQTSEEFKRHIEENRELQKKYIKEGRAALCAVEWTVGNSRRDGERMQKQYTKLLLRAFNGECDAAIAKVAWNNISRMEERIRKAFSAINELGGVMKVSITSAYSSLKLAELRLRYEYEEKKHLEVEEQRRIKEQMREEERVQRELEKAQFDARVEEDRFERALEKARVEVAKAKGAEHERLNQKVLELQQQLEEAKQKRERATSMAQLTKAGYIYIISNIGSFGEDVFKIGMTRRLEPMDRIRELGDASVPFSFDVHAMVYCENAPTLECEFHNHFAKNSINLINMRKEFFRISIDELESFAESRKLSIAFTKLAEAREYRETLALKLQNERRSNGGAEPVFPDCLPFEAAASQGAN